MRRLTLALVAGRAFAPGVPISSRTCQTTGVSKVQARAFVAVRPDKSGLGRRDAAPRGGQGRPFDGLRVAGDFERVYLK